MPFLWAASAFLTNASDALADGIYTVRRASRIGGVVGRALELVEEVPHAFSDFSRGYRDGDDNDNGDGGRRQGGTGVLSPSSSISVHKRCGRTSGRTTPSGPTCSSSSTGTTSIRSRGWRGPRRLHVFRGRRQWRHGWTAVRLSSGYAHDAKLGGSGAAAQEGDGRVGVRSDSHERARSAAKPQDSGG